MPELSIIIPCYNEAKNIPILIDIVKSTICHTSEVILVDNGSLDETITILPELVNQLNNPSIRTLRVDQNIGYGNGLLRGIDVSRGNYIAWTHADLQTDINDIYIGYRKILEKNVNNFFFLKGKRNNRPFLDHFLTFGMSVFSSIMLKQKLHDINAQPKMFHRDFLQLVTNPPADFSLDLYFYYLAKKNNFRIIELPVNFNKRLFGEAKGGGGASLKNRVKLIIRTINYIFELKIKIKQQNN